MVQGFYRLCTIINDRNIGGISQDNYRGTFQYIKPKFLDKIVIIRKINDVRKDV